MKSNPIQLSSHWEMFIDKYLIESMDGTELRLHHPQDREVVITFDQPWEGENSAYPSVVQTEDSIRIFYRGNCYGEDNDEAQITCLAESKDGVHFTKPELGMIEFNGNNHNNICYKGSISSNLAVFADQRAGVSKDERFKAVGGASEGELVMQNKGKLYGLKSRDGMSWELIQEQPILEKGSFDSHNVVFWDELNQAYRCYNRYFQNTDKGMVRSIQSSISEDFYNWSDPIPHQYHYPNTTKVELEQLYTNATIPCIGAPQILLSFPMRIRFDRKKHAEHSNDGVSDSVLMTSRDGVNWDRTFMESWRRPGPDPLNWTDRNGVVAFGCVELNNEFSFYVTEHYRHKTARLRRVSVRKHGFASVYAGYYGGEFVTRPVLLGDHRIMINYATSSHGSIQAEILDLAGNTLPGFSLEDCDVIYGDEYDKVIQWSGGEAIHTMEPVRIRFVLKDANLFAIRGL